MFRAKKAAGLQRGISRCLTLLKRGFWVIDGSVTAANGSRLDRAIWGAVDVLRRHWVLALLLVAGLALRALAQIGYEPALLFIDSKKYIFGTTSNYNDWGSYDPIGYTLVVLRPVLMFANLAFVAFLQHVLGLAMAVALYVLMLRLSVSRWLAALAVAPVLLDAYQLNAEQTIMPDVLFEALLVAGMLLLLWQRRPGIAFVMLGGLALGASAPMRQVGEALIVPALVYVLAATRGWRTKLLHGAALTFCFALPVVGYMAYSAVILHYGFEMSNMGDAYLYGRAAHAADCATLKLPADERPLCPSAAVAAKLGVDGLVNSKHAPRVTYMPVNVQLGLLINTMPEQRGLAYNVIRQQPLRVIGDITKDAVKIFALTRNTEEGDTPISRWQFQTSYPTYPPGITAQGDNSATNLFKAAGGGGDARVYRPAAIVLRDYQLHGGYTPGPVFLLALLAGIAGIFTFRRRGDPVIQGQALACLLITSCAVAVLLGADVYEFSWRYQLPALVTLPIAGALGATALVRHFGPRRRAVAAAGVPADEVSELAVAGSEQVS
jgi:Dolichyl-phosphate-mannose-protein mannosyltransferase